MSEEPQAGAQAPTILLLDDDPAVQRTVGRLLSRAGFQVLNATSAVEAIQTAADHERSIELLIADHGLGSMSGVRVAEVLARGRPGLPVLYISGSEEREVLGTASGSPGVAFLQKPFSRQSLLEQVQRLLDSR